MFNAAMLVSDAKRDGDERLFMIFSIKPIGLSPEQQNISSLAAFVIFR
jgi:hypothetical protein